MPEQQPQQGSKISNFEWGLVTGAAFVIDIVQVVLDMFAIGIVANRLIDIIAGMAFPFYFYMRGVKLSTKKVFAWIASFLLEEIPLIDALPLWSGDVLLTMAWDKADKKILSKVPMAGLAVNMANRHENISNINQNIKNQAKNIKAPNNFNSTQPKQTSPIREATQYPKEQTNTTKQPNNVLDLQNKIPQNQPKTQFGQENEQPKRTMGSKKPDWMSADLSEVEKDPNAYLQKMNLEAKRKQEQAKRNSQSVREMLDNNDQQKAA